MRPCYGPLIANGNRGTTFFQDDYLFGIVVQVERNHRAGVHDFRPHIKVLGVSVLLVDLDNELRN